MWVEAELGRLNALVYTLAKAQSRPTRPMSPVESDIAEVDTADEMQISFGLSPVRRPCLSVSTPQTRVTAGPINPPSPFAAASLEGITVTLSPPRLAGLNKQSAAPPDPFHGSACPCTPTSSIAASNLAEGIIVTLSPPWLGVNKQPAPVPLPDTADCPPAGPCGPASLPVASLAEGIILPLSPQRLDQHKQSALVYPSDTADCPLSTTQPLPDTPPIPTSTNSTESEAPQSPNDTVSTPNSPTSCIETGVQTPPMVIDCSDCHGSFVAVDVYNRDMERFQAQLTAMKAAMQEARATFKTEIDALHTQLRHLTTQGVSQPGKTQKKDPTRLSPSPPAVPSKPKHRQCSPPIPPANLPPALAPSSSSPSQTPPPQTTQAPPPSTTLPHPFSITVPENCTTETVMPEQQPTSSTSTSSSGSAGLLDIGRESSQWPELKQLRPDTSTVIIGDSVVSGLHAHKMAVSMEKVQVLSESGLDRAGLVQLLKGTSPHHAATTAVIHVGINDTKRGHVIGKGAWHSVWQAARRCFPNARLLMSSILPTTSNHQHISACIADSNTNLYQVCQRYGAENAFINHDVAFYTRRGEVKSGWMRDKFHPNQRGSSSLAVGLKRRLFGADGETPVDPRRAAAARPAPRRDADPDGRSWGRGAGARGRQPSTGWTDRPHGASGPDRRPRPAPDFVPPEPQRAPGRGRPASPYVPPIPSTPPVTQPPQHVSQDRAPAPLPRPPPGQQTTGQPAPGPSGPGPFTHHHHPQFFYTGAPAHGPAPTSTMHGGRYHGGPPLNPIAIHLMNLAASYQYGHSAPPH